MNFKNLLFATSTLGLAYGSPALAQDSQSADENVSSNDIIVTAQRSEQKLQDVPISITVLSQQTLTNNNISNAKDLAAYTPGLAVNNRYGSDNTTFTIRGFYQEQRSFATVGVFFNDVVAPRGSGATFGGDGAGPGSLFDLQNVQVLKGPQGTLFGRNVTGGAVLLVPQKPKDKTEGYIEGSVGNYNMWRTQGVVNFAISDTARMRIGVDHQDRHGFLKNAGRFGDGSFANRGLGDVNYWAARASLVLDLAPDIENYTIFSYTHTQSNGVSPKITAAFAPAGNPNCNPVASLANFGCESIAQMAREAPFGFWSISNRLPDAQSITNSWQAINTTTWQASDSLKVKYIFSYAQFKGKTNLDLFGNYALLPGVAFGTETLSQVNGFAFTHNEGNFGLTNAQSSLVEEIQLQGEPGDGRFKWQAGGYMEINNPLGFSGVQTASFTPCTNIVTFSCSPASAAQGIGGTGSYSLQRTKFRDYAVYAQASYKVTPELTFTGGLRYTWDTMNTFLINETSVFNAVPANVKFGCTNITAPGFLGVINGFGPNPALSPITSDQRLNSCGQFLSNKSSAPTWLVQADYKPTDGVMIYGKWSRGYRQGGLAIFGPDPIQSYRPEKVDTYELGAKTNWQGAVPGSFNIAGYYNDFRNQQLQLGVACVASLPNFTGGCAGNATIINSGKSKIWGLEADLNFSPFKGMKVNLSYGYINAKILQLTIPSVLPPYNSITAPLATGCGGPQCNTIANSGPPHQLVASLAYTLPTDESAGKFTLGGTLVYQSARRIVSDAVINRANPANPITSGAGIAPSSTVLNLNATWEDVGGMPIDFSAFMTNVTNEHVILQINDNTLRGFISSTIGEPRMWGFRLRYKFGN